MEDGVHNARKVVLVPGLDDDERKMRFVAADLTKQGMQPYTLSPQPSDGTVPLDELACQLVEQATATLGAVDQFALVGFSMGGLIGRYYLQQLGGDARVNQFITVATPHRGSLTAQLVATKPALRQMCQGSDFLTQLNQDLAHLHATRFCALWTPFDLSVVPPVNGYLPGFSHHRVWSPFHATLLMDPLVIRRLRRLLLCDAAG